MSIRVGFLRSFSCTVLACSSLSCGSSDGPNGAPALVNSIVFVSDRTGAEEIYVMNGDGSNVRQLTTSGGYKSYPVVSPDGRKIVFTEGILEDHEVAPLYIINSDGTGLRQLTHSNALDYQATWSPDGNGIAFSSTRDGNNEIYLMSADGTDQINITRNAGADYAPVWRPGARSILFASDRDHLGGENGEIYSLNMLGFSVTPLVAGFDPAWSPSGSKFLFKRDGQIYISDTPDGSSVRQLTSFLSSFYTPSWSPDERTIIFTSFVSGYEAIWAINADDGTGLHQLTTSDMLDCAYVTYTRH